MLILTGSIGLSAFSAEAQDSVDAQRPPATSPYNPVQLPRAVTTGSGIQAQPAAGPFGDFRINRLPFFGGNRNDQRSTLRYRSPRSASPSPDLPKPPASAPALEAEPEAATDQQANKPEPTTTPQSSTPIRPTRPATISPPAAAATGPASAPADDWVAREAINQTQPLRDPRSRSPVIKTPSQTDAKPTTQRPASDTTAEMQLDVPPSNSSLDSNPEGDEAATVELLSPTPNDDATAVDSLSTESDPAPSEATTSESLGPLLNAPTLNPPENGPPVKSNDYLAERSVQQQDNVADTVADNNEPESRISRAPSREEAQQKELQVRRPKIQSPQSEGRELPETASRYGGSETQYVGTEPRQTELDYTGRPAEEFAVSSRVLRMKPGIERVLQYFYSRPEIADQRSNWGMMHAIMVYGADTRILSGRKSYSAIGWIAGNNICRGKRLLLDDENGIKADNGVGLQGHQAQLLCVLSLCDVPDNYPLYANNNKYTVRDLVKTEMAACKSGEELTFTLIGLSHYLDTDATWVSADGERWDFPKLIREELGQPIVGSACGGTHRLMGFGHALRKRRAEGRPITGQWARAEKFTQDFLSYAYQLQNRDGSMSSRWFEGRADDGDTDRKIQTTGHIVEWLLTVTPDAELQNPRLVAAVGYLLSAMYRDLDHDWQIGPKGHALRSLAMFHDRVYKSGPAWKNDGIASRDTTLNR